MPLEAKTEFSFLALRCLVLIVACLGLAWAIPNLAASAISDDFRDLDARLLQFETVTPASAIRMLQIAEGEALSFCDTDAQHALLLMEIPLAEIALRSGAAQDFDRHVNAIESRSRRVLGCTPRDSLVWLLLFGIEIEHGNLGAHAFDLLEMSYTTSPNEGWLGVRDRITVAVPRDSCSAQTASTDDSRRIRKASQESAGRNSRARLLQRVFAGSSVAAVADRQTRCQQPEVVLRRIGKASCFLSRSRSHAPAVISEFVSHRQLLKFRGGPLKPIVLVTTSVRSSAGRRGFAGIGLNARTVTAATRRGLPPVARVRRQSVHILIATARPADKNQTPDWRSTIQQFPQGDVVSTSRPALLCSPGEMKNKADTNRPASLEQWYSGSAVGVVKKI